MSALSSSRRFRITMFILFIAAVVLMSAIGMSFPAESTGIEQVANSRSAKNQIALSESIHQPEKISTTDTISETIIVPFKNGIHGVQTSRSYSEEVSVTVKGIGQASGPSWSDAFYVFTDYEGNPVTPHHSTNHFNYTLWINGGPPEPYVSPIPAYNPSHIYTFQLEGKDNPFNFAVGDNGTGDNTGGYTIIIESESGAPPPVAGRTTQSLRALVVPTIDGDFSEWPATSGAIMNLSTVKTVNGVRPSNPDVSASVRSVWTDSMLYFAVAITDNALVADSAKVWEDDAFEIALDALHDHLPGGVDDHQFTTTVDGRTADFGSLDDSYIAAVQTRIDGWNLEAALPVGNFGLARFTSGKVMGLNLGLIDDDTPGDADTHLLWESDRTWQTMSDWGQIKLVENDIPPITPEPSLTPTPNGETVTLQKDHQNYQGTDDTYIQEWDSNQNFGAANTFTVRSNGIATSLIHFDLTSIPEHARIKAATLSLYSVDRSNPQGVFGIVYRILRPWEELGATWLQARSGAPWEVPGAVGSGDRDSDPITTQIIDKLENWASFDITKLAQLWVDNPDQNLGIMVQGATGGSVAYDFVSREVVGWENEPYRPELIISYWEPVPTATPTDTPTATPSPTPTPTPTITPTSTPLCLDDFEPDDSWQQAKLIFLDADTQQHNFHQPGDVDYVKFGVTAGTELTLYTDDLGSGVDTTLTLFDNDGVTEIAYNDIDPANPPASRIDWTAPASGTYFLKAAHFNPEAGGCNMTYELAVERVTPTPTPTLIPLYLPLMVK